MSNFGELYGTSISNKDTILEEIDKELGRKPSLEYLITYPIGYFNLPFGLGTFTYNSYGHSSLRYIDQYGNDIIANIEAKEVGKPFIQFYKTQEYLYGIIPETCGAQRGVYNRNIVGIRVYGIKPENMREMHEHIIKLIQIEHEKVEFNIFFGPMLNIVRLYFPNFNLPEFGNCSKWTSTMLQKAGVIDKTFVWPRTVFIDIFEMAHKRGFETDVVFYEKPDHVKKPSLGVKSNGVLFEGIAPFQFVRNWMYGDLRYFSNIIVQSKLEKDKTTRAIIKRNHNVLKPDKFRNLLNNKYVIGINVGCSMYLTYSLFKFAKKMIVRK
jgi:hypothetical protein